jgi:hypothetical protein
MSFCMGLKLGVSLWGKNISEGIYVGLQGLQPWWWRQYVPSNPHGIATQKSNVDIITVMRTSNFISERVFEQSAEENIKTYVK